MDEVRHTDSEGSKHHDSVFIDDGVAKVREGDSLVGSVEYHCVGMVIVGLDRDSRLVKR